MEDVYFNTLIMREEFLIFDFRFSIASPASVGDF
jgi:hypothetical protein